jgi:hypothetical protein
MIRPDLPMSHTPSHPVSDARPGPLRPGTRKSNFLAATLFYPPLRLIVGSVTTSAAITVGGVALMVLPSLIVGLIALNTLPASSKRTH